MLYSNRISINILLVITLLIVSFVSEILTDNNSKEGKQGKKRQHQSHNKQRQKNNNNNGGIRHGKSSLSRYNWTESLPFPPTSDSFWRKDLDIDIVDPPEQSSKSQSHERNSKESSRRSGTLVEDRPNIILIITDDQDIELGSMNYMPETLRVFRDEGIEFRHGYVTTPMCCPSRSSLLTGLYVHNHQIYTNNDNCSSITWRSKYEKKTFAHYLHSSGYHTSYIGKYLNKYDGSHIPSGWSEWSALLMNSRFYNYTVNRNGRKVRYGNVYETDYYPDVITNETLDFLDRMSARDASQQKPFLLVASFPSPHGPEDSAPQYSNLFMNATPHHLKSYDYAPNLDKQWILRVTDKMTPQLKDFTNLLMTKRLQTLQSVDVAIKQMFNRLEESGLINSTYVFYTSDHGYHVGQFGLVKGKSMPYEFDIRVPFYLSPPKDVFNGSAFIPEPILNIDLAPTFLELANITVPPHMDGRSLVPLLNKYMKRTETLSDWGHTFIIESSGRRELPTDTKPNPTKRHQQDNKNNSSDRLTTICNQHPYPCQENQKKYCRMDRNRIRFRKCRLGLDYQEQDLGFGSWNDNGKSSSWNFTKCRCSRDVGPNMNFDWEEERGKIDMEIDELKLRIIRLREKRRNMRNQWIEGLKGQKGRGKQFSRLWPDDLSEDDDISNSSTNFKMVTQKGVSLSGHSHDDDDDQEEDDESKIPKFFQNNSDEEDSDEEENHGDKNQQSKQSVQDIFPANSTNFDDGMNKNNKRHRKVTSKVVGERNQSQEEEGTSSHRRGYKNKNRPSGGRNKKINTNYRHQIDHEDFERNRNCDCSGVLGGGASDGSFSFQGGDPRILRMMEKEDRKRRKLKSKVRKKERFLNRIEDPEERVLAETCGHEEKMNCFWHDNDHWKTPPLWTSGSFCFCPSSNNNTFSCLRSINATHDYLYCHFMTGFKMFFDLVKDPQELHNLIGSLPADQEEWMLSQLFRLKKCKGRSCWFETEDYIETPEIENTEFPEDSISIQPTIWEQIFGRWKGNKKKKNHQGRKRHN